MLSRGTPSSVLARTRCRRFPLVFLCCSYTLLRVQDNIMNSQRVKVNPKFRVPSAVRLRWSRFWIYGHLYCTILYGNIKPLSPVQIELSRSDTAHARQANDDMHLVVCFRRIRQRYYDQIQFLTVVAVTIAVISNSKKMMGKCEVLYLQIVSLARNQGYK